MGVTPRSTFWVWAGRIAPFLAVAVSYGILQANVARNEKDLDKKADWSTVQTQYQSIMRELDEMHTDIRDMKGTK